MLLIEVQRSMQSVRFKEKNDAYAHSRDMSVSQLMRKLLKKEMEDNGVPPISGWSMHDKS